MARVVWVCICMVGLSFAASAQAAPPPPNLPGPPDSSGQSPPPPPADITKPAPNVTTAPTKATSGALLSSRTSLRERSLTLALQCAPQMLLGVQLVNKPRHGHVLFRYRHRFAKCAAVVLRWKVTLPKRVARKVRHLHGPLVRVSLRQPDGKRLLRTVRLTRPGGPELVLSWKDTNAWLDCYPLNGGVIGGGDTGNEFDFTRNWHSPVNGTVWFYERLVVEEFHSTLGTFWYSPDDGYVTDFSKAPRIYGPYRMIRDGVLEWGQYQQNPFASDPPVFISQPRTWATTWLKGYDTYIRAFAGLWLYASDGWHFQWGNVATHGSPTDAPGWCWLP